MAMQDWDIREDGNLLVGPSLGWETALAPMTGLLRLRYAHNEDRLERGGDAVQVTLTAAQARKLSEDLRQMADQLDRENSASGTKQ